jgi:hypothetical protein
LTVLVEDIACDACEWDKKKQQTEEGVEETVLFKFPTAVTHGGKGISTGRE